MDMGSIPSEEVHAEQTVRELDILDSPELLERLRAGDDSAFEVLVRGATGRLLALSYRMLGQTEDAEDAVQAAFMSAFRNLPGFEGGSKLTTWLHRIAVNECLMRLRTRRRKPTTSLESVYANGSEVDTVTLGSSGWAARPIEVASQSEVSLRVREAIDELPEDFRTVVVLRDIEGLRTSDVATTLEISEAAVKTRLHRARIALRTILEPVLTEKPE